MFIINLMFFWPYITV